MRCDGENFVFEIRRRRFVDTHERMVPMRASLVSCNQEGCLGTDLNFDSSVESGEESWWGGKIAIPLFSSFLSLPFQPHLAANLLRTSIVMSSLPVTPPNLAELPIALALPDELWIKILRELDYATLKKSSRICRKLQRFIGVSYDSSWGPEF